MSILFKNLGKNAKDLLDNKKHYTTGGNKKFSIETKAAGDIKYSAESTINGAKIDGKFSYDYKAEGLNEKVSVSTSGCLKSDTTYECANNLLLTLSTASKSLTQHEGDIGAEYSHEDFKAKFVCAPLCKNTAKASICFKKDDFYAGGEAGVSLGDGFDIDQYDFGLGYSSCQQNYAYLHVTNKLSTVKLSLFRKHDADTALAGTVTANFGDETPSPAIELGGSYKVDRDTSVYGKLTAPKTGTKDLTASFTLDHKLNNNASLSLTSVLDLDPEHAQNFMGSQFGLSLKFGSS